MLPLRLKNDHKRSTFNGVMGAYGLMLGLMEDPSDKNLERTFLKIKSTRPTAVNLN